MFISDLCAHLIRIGRWALRKSLVTCFGRERRMFRGCFKLFCLVSDFPAFWIAFRFARSIIYNVSKFLFDYKFPPWRLAGLPRRYLSSVLHNHEGLWKRENNPSRDRKKEMPKKQCGKNLYQVIRETINWRVVVIKLLSPKKNFLPNLSAKYRLRLMRARPPLFFYFFEIPPNDLSAIDFRNQVGGWSDKREFFSYIHVLFHCLVSYWLMPQKCLIDRFPPFTAH